MSTAIKSIIFSFLILTAQAALADDLKVLSVKEFIQKKDATKFVQENLNNLEINNDELVVLTKITSEKKKLSKAKKLETVLVAKL